MHCGAGLEGLLDGVLSAGLKAWTVCCMVVAHELLPRLPRPAPQPAPPRPTLSLHAPSQVVVVDAEQARQSTSTILEEHNIAAHASKDIKDQLEAWAGEEEPAGTAGATVAPPTPEKA